MSHLAECPLHPGCPIVGGRCACGEHWDGATLEVMQAVRLGLLGDHPFIVELMRIEFCHIVTESIASFTCAGESATQQLKALETRGGQMAVQEFLRRQALKQSLPRLNFKDPRDLTPEFTAHQARRHLYVQPSRHPQASAEIWTSDPKPKRICFVLTPEQEAAEQG